MRQNATHLDLLAGVNNVYVCNGMRNNNYVSMTLLGYFKYILADLKDVNFSVTIKGYSYVYFQLLFYFLALFTYFC